LTTNAVQAAAGSDVVHSGNLNTRLRAGKYYLIATGWDESVTYRSGGTHPSSVAFGESVKGYTDNTTYQPSSTASGSVSTLL